MDKTITNKIAEKLDNIKKLPLSDYGMNIVVLAINESIKETLEEIRDYYMAKKGTKPFIDDRAVLEDFIKTVSGK